VKPSTVYFGGFTLLVAGLLALRAAPLPFPKPTPDDALATAGLTPLTAETGNLSLAEFKRQLHPLKPDLVITRVVFEPARPKVGALIGTIIYYKNIGGKPAKNFCLRKEPGTLGTDGFGLGGDYAQLAPGQEKPYHWGAIKAAKAGAHTLDFSVDPEGTVEESNEKNNRHAARLHIDE
jgi:hypothetical protein